jgi:hypothetical protein
MSAIACFSLQSAMVDRKMLMQLLTDVREKFIAMPCGYNQMCG